MVKLLSEECEFHTRLGVLRGQRWGMPGAKPVLALHGWLDNSASFDLLAPKLTDVDLIALDLPGHGLSDFRQRGRPHNIWEDLHDIYAVVNDLGWRKFSIIGHSKGAMLGMLFAGCFPEMVVHLACLDALYPQPVSDSKAPEQLAAAIVSAAKCGEEKRTVYPTKEDAVSARCDGLYKLSREDALILAERGLTTSEEGVRWRYDPELLLPSDMKFTKRQIQAFLTRIQIKVLLLAAQDGVAENHKEALEEIKQFPFIDFYRLPGGHHFHMTENAEAVKDHIESYFNGKR